jgi:hypothetical protein
MVPELDQITAIENEYRAPLGNPTLGDAFSMLRIRWEHGCRDRETGLRLMFLAWYACAEPPCSTGLRGQADFGQVFREIFAHLGGVASTDPELLCAVGLMCGDLFPWCVGPEDEWSALGMECRRAAKRLKPEGFPPEQFEGRGAYGDYFAHMARTGALSGSESG